MLPRNGIKVGKVGNEELPHRVELRDAIAAAILVPEVSPPFWYSRSASATAEAALATSWPM